MLDGTTVVNVILDDSLIVIVNDGVTSDGVTNDGVTNDGVTNDGVINDGVTSDGVTNDGVTNDGVILDDSTTLAVVFLAAMDVTVKDGVIALVSILVNVGVTSVLETALVSKVLETTTMLLIVACVTSMLLVVGEEVSIGMVDEIIGGLDKGDTVLVKDMMEIVSLVENPLPGSSDVESPLPINSDDGITLEVIITALLGVSNNVEATMLVSIPLPISSLLSALLSLLLYCSHVSSAE